MTLPTGRATKPTAKVRYATRVPVIGSRFVKNSWLKTRPAAVPKMKKSYHSMVAPMELASATFLGETSSPLSSPPSFSIPWSNLPSMPLPFRSFRACLALPRRYRLFPAEATYCVAYDHRFFVHRDHVSPGAGAPGADASLRAHGTSVALRVQREAIPVHTLADACPH